MNKSRQSLENHLRAYGIHLGSKEHAHLKYLLDSTIAIEVRDALVIKTAYRRAFKKLGKEHKKLAYALEHIESFDQT